MTRVSPMVVLHASINGFDNIETPSFSDWREIEEQLFCEFMLSVGWLEQEDWSDMRGVFLGNNDAGDERVGVACQLNAMKFGLPTLEVRLE